MQRLHTRSALSTAIASALAATLTLAACGGSVDNASPPAPTPPPPPSFTLTLSSEHAVVLQGATLTLKARVQRSAGFEGPVVVALGGLPAGVTAGAVTIAAGTTEADVTLAAADTAPHSLPTTVQATGSANAASAQRSFTVTVRGAAGRVDTSFASGGKAVTPVGAGEDGANAVAVQADGKLLVAGTVATAGGTQLALVRYGRDGSLDTRFGNGGKVMMAVGNGRDDAANAVAVQPDGKIVVAGSALQTGTGLDFAVLRFHADGTPDGSFGQGGKVTFDFAGDSDRAWALVLQDDGKIVVGGEANLGNNASGVDFALARLNADGTLDAGFGAGGKLTTALKSGTGGDVVRALALQTVDGQPRLVAAGGEGDFLAARYTANGTLDGAWGQGGKVVGLFGTVIGGARAVAALPDGAVVLAGHADHRFAAAQLSPAGQPDARFGAGTGRFTLGLVPGWNEATALARQADGRLVVAGWAYSGNSSSGDFAALRLNADGTLDTAFATNGVVITPMAPSTKNDLAHALVLQPDERVPAVRAVIAGEANDSNHDIAVLRLWL